MRIAGSKPGERERFRARSRGGDRDRIGGAYVSVFCVIR